MSDELQQALAMIDQLSNRVADLETQQVSAQFVDNARFRVLLAKKNTAKQWQEQAASGGAIVDIPAGGRPRQATSDTAPAAIIDRGDSVVLLELQDQVGMRYVQVSSDPPTFIPVICQQTGGSAGNDTTQCSFTYTIKELDGTTVIASNVAVSGNGLRIVNAEMEAGTVGIAYVDNGGDWKLLFVDERFTQHTCEE